MKQGKESEVSEVRPCLKMSNMIVEFRPISFFRREATFCAEDNYHDVDEMGVPR